MSQYVMSLVFSSENLGAISTCRVGILQADSSLSKLDVLLTTFRPIRKEKKNYIGNMSVK